MSLEVNENMAMSMESRALLISERTASWQPPLGEKNALNSACAVAAMQTKNNTIRDLSMNFMGTLKTGFLEDFFKIFAGIVINLREIYSKPFARNDTGNTGRPFNDISF